MITFIFLISAISCFSVAIYCNCKYNKQNYVEVYGTCISTTRNRYSVRGTYKYKYKGNEYTCEDNYSHSAILVILRRGNICKLYINPHNPKDVITPIDRGRIRDWIFLGVFFSYLVFCDFLFNIW